MQAFIYHLTMMRSKRYIQKTYGKSFWKQFQALSDPVFHQVSKELPDIGDSIFSFNYAYAPSYVARNLFCRLYDFPLYGQWIFSNKNIGSRG